MKHEHRLKRKPEEFMVLKPIGFLSPPEKCTRAPSNTPLLRGSE